MKNLCNGILLGILSLYTGAYAQDTPSLPRPSPELTFQDSLSIFNLVDSLLQLGDIESSQLAVRIGYNSNVLSAGRTLGIQNFGLSPGVSYFHKSGLYADVTAYYSKDFTPSYYLTVASLGYMKDLTDHFSVMAGFDKYFYNIDNSYIPYSNTLSLTPIFDWKILSVSLTYSLYFGDQHVHRLAPAISLTFAKHDLWKFDRVSIVPSFYMLYGNETLTTIEYVEPKTLREAIQNRLNYGTRYSLVQKDENVFGVMNYAVSLPLRVTLNHWSFSLTYTYNIPKALPGEPFTLENSSFLSGNIMYLINFSGK